MEQTYTKKEVQDLIEPLMQQIEYLQSQYLKCKSWISGPWNQRLFENRKFLNELLSSDDNSQTLIFDLANWIMSNPKLYLIFKSQYYISKN